MKAGFWDRIGDAKKASFCLRCLTEPHQEPTRSSLGGIIIH
jgi:hypothetical protein